MTNGIGQLICKQLEFSDLEYIGNEKGYRTFMKKQGREYSYDSMGNNQCLPSYIISGATCTNATEVDEDCFRNITDINIKFGLMSTTTSTKF